MEIEQVTVFMSSIEADRFRQFQKYHALFEQLEEVGLFNMRFGKVTLNVAFNELQNIVKEEMVWKNPLVSQRKE